MQSLDQIDLKNMKNIVLQKLKERLSDERLNPKKHADLIIDLLMKDRNLKYCESKICQVNEENKNLEEEIQLKHTEIVEFDEGFLKDVFKFIEDYKILEEKLEEKLSETELQVEQYCIESFAESENMIKFVRKIREMPYTIEALQAKYKMILDIEYCKLDSIKTMIEDCHSQQKTALDKIASIENKIFEEEKLIKNCNDLINQENQKSSQIAEYNDKTTMLQKKIIEFEQNISNAEIMIKEKSMNIDNLKMTVQDLKKNIQNEQVIEKSLVESIKNVEEKRDLIKKKVIKLDELDSVIDLNSNNEYLKEKENIQKLKTEKEQLYIDVQNTKKYTEELEKELASLKTKNDGDILKFEDQIESFTKRIETKKGELDTLRNENEKLNEENKAYKHEKDALKMEINNLLSEVSFCSKSVKSKKDTPLISNYLLKTKKTKGPSNNIQNWLADLPPRFTTSSSNDFSKNATKDSSSTQLEEEQKNMLESKDSERSLYKNFNLDVPNPDEMDDIMEYSFSENTANSEYGIEDSFISLDF